ncbi:MAG: (2Fe-2S) ferredoxin domain-containing protein [Rickettsiella sp.]|nr:(2Fe-2S) ferredoxin domain-containing protein [Rickettsiella sp.]
MTYYQQHIFLCINERDNNRDCCAKQGSLALLDYLKTKIKTLPKNKEKKIRVNSTSCLGRCKLGPVLVIYPESIWYHCKTQIDIDEIIEKQIINKEIVTRLLLSNEHKAL